MFVFKTRTGSGEVFEINAVNFMRATGGREPYKSVRGDGRNVYYAVCPACDNPIVLVGLYRNERGMDRPRRPFGRHCGHDVPALAEYDEDAYRACRYADPGHRVNSWRKRGPSDPHGLALYGLMRSEFDNVALAWELSSGIHLGRAYAEEMLRGWRANEGWRYYVASYQNLPQMLFWPAGSQKLMGRYVRRGSRLHGLLDRSGLVSLEPRGNRYVQVRRASGRFMEASFVIYDRTFSPDGDGDGDEREVFDARVDVDGREVASDLRITAEADWLERTRTLTHGRRDERLLEIAGRILG